MSKANIEEIHVQNVIDDTPLHFIPNKGQWHSNILYKAYAPQYELSFMQKQILLKRDNNTLVLAFYGSHTDRRVCGNSEAEGKFHFIKGKNSSKWYINIPTFLNIRYEKYGLVFR